jgi:hypothetical protein
MRSREELLKIKEAFAYAMMDMLDVYDEFIGTTTRKLWQGQVPTVNDLAKNEEESIGKIIVDDTDTNRGDTYVR